MGAGLASEHRIKRLDSVDHLQALPRRIGAYLFMVADSVADVYDFSIETDSSSVSIYLLLLPPRMHVAPPNNVCNHNQPTSKLNLRMAS